LEEQLNIHKKEVSILRSERETLHSVLTMKYADTNKGLQKELHRVVEDIRRHYGNQKAENLRLQQQMKQLQNDKLAIEQEVHSLRKKVEELELQIGNDNDSNDQ